MAFPTFKKGDFCNSCFYASGQNQGLPSNFIDIRYMTEKNAHIIEELESKPDLVNNHLESGIILLNRKSALRPIAVQNSIQKMTELSMKHYFRELNNLSTNQFEFKIGLSTAHAVIKFLHTYRVSQRGSPKEPKGIVLIDFSKAYDRVGRDKLFEVLDGKKVEKNSLYLLK